MGVSEAVSKEEADKLGEERDKKGKDRRNLWLMKEGGEEFCFDWKKNG